MSRKSGCGLLLIAAIVALLALGLWYVSQRVALNRQVPSGTTAPSRSPLRG